jgi:uncharacterized protein YegL
MDTSTTSNPNSGLQDVDFNYGFGDFNPDDVEVEDTINVQFVVDVSSSVRSYVSELNSGFNEFVARMQTSHSADKIFVSVVVFNQDVEVISGYQPIKSMGNIDFGRYVSGTTALYGGTKVALENALNYREGLENAGVNCKTLLFVMTDGGDNEPRQGTASDVKTIIDDLLTEERNFASFETMLFGINKSEETTFNNAAAEMGITNVVTIGNTADEIKKMINFISSSVSNASGNGNAISVANF